MATTHIRTIHFCSGGLAQAHPNSKVHSIVKAGRETVHPADMQMVKSSPILFVDNSTWNQNGMAQSTRLDSKLAWYGTRVLDAFPLVDYTKIC